MQWAKQKGFTIVELLIVVVVIAILAAITIVAYNGIQNRAKESAAQSAASQAAKKALAYAPLNNDQYPDKATFRADLALPADTDQAVYDYYVSNDRKSFCLSTTNPSVSNGVSYAQTQSSSNIKGRCVENLVINPSFENGVVGWSAANGAVPTISSAAAMTGDNGVSLTTSSTSDSGIGRSFTFTPNTKYAMSCMIRSTGTVSFNFSSSAQATALAGGTQVRLLTGGQQLRIGSVLTTGSTTAGGMTYCLRVGGQSGSVTFHVDGVMLTQTDKLYSYGDGNSPNWAWTGDPASSTSFGPAIAE